MQTDFGDNPKMPQLFWGVRMPKQHATLRTDFIALFSRSSAYSINVFNGYPALRGSTLSLVERTVPTSST
ncbi:MAG: hypothetical protein WCF38_16595, partial [Pseudolabrys sp.]